MARIPSIPAADYNDAQQAFFESLTGGPRAQLRPKKEFLNAEGGVGGPFHPWIHSPITGKAALELGAKVRFENALAPDLRELAILVVGAHARASYEWWAHAKIASAEGVSDDILNDVKAGRAPQDASEDQKIVCQVARELVTGFRVSDDTYATAQARLGNQAVVDIVITTGYYCMISMTLNAFQIPLPEGEQDPFAIG